MEAAPIIRVGIMEGQSIRYAHHGEDCVVTFTPEFQDIVITDGPFTLHDVTIGKQFHWEQQEDQTFLGTLRIISDGSTLHAINEVCIEDYLASVISSEMAATNNLELLKTHAIISRSWAIAMVREKRQEITVERKKVEGEIIRFWDHDDHTLFDVCADDHCQRYQGITRQISPLVAEAIRQTRGIVLTDCNGDICDARFYKACGGHTERFSACWQDRDHHYLEPVSDPYCAPDFIATLPGGLDGVMRQVLNSYDQATSDYHEWTEHYTAESLSDLVERRLHLSLGRIKALEPVERGASGRIVRLRIVGSEGSIVIGKELLIRKALSESHLKSSWFDVEPIGDPAEPSAFILHGHGWGHGVGLCQIGAAAMSIAGYGYQQILGHYYHGATLQRIWE